MWIEKRRHSIKSIHKGSKYLSLQRKIFPSYVTINILDMKRYGDRNIIVPIKDINSKAAVWKEWVNACVCAYSFTGGH